MSKNTKNAHGSRVWLTVFSFNHTKMASMQDTLAPPMAAIRSPTGGPAPPPDPPPTWHELASGPGEDAEKMLFWASGIERKLDNLHERLTQSSNTLQNFFSAGTEQMNQIASGVMQTATYTQYVDNKVQQSMDAIVAAAAEEFQTQRDKLNGVVTEAQQTFGAHHVALKKQEENEKDSREKLEFLAQTAQAIMASVEDKFKEETRMLDQKLARFQEVVNQGPASSDRRPDQAFQRESPGKSGAGWSPPGMAATQPPPDAWASAAGKGGNPYMSAAAAEPAGATSWGYGAQSPWWQQDWQQHQTLEAKGPDYNRLFEDKVALTLQYAYIGGHSAEGEKWRKTTRGYWMSRLPVIKDLIDWAERQDTKEINSQTLMIAQQSGELSNPGQVDMTRLSQCIWGFLNNCVTGEARSFFDGADVLNGLDAWRRLVTDIHKNRWVRREQLRNLVRHIPKINKLEDIVAACTTFDNNIKLYQEASGKTVDPEDKKADLMGALPTEIREQLQWRMSLGESYEEFRNHLVATSNNMLFQRGKFPSPVQNVEEELAGNDSIEDALVAALGRMGFKGKGGGKGKGFGKGTDSGGGKGGFGQGGAGAGGASQGIRRCINCGSTQHLTAACNKPEVPREKRPCWKCGKPGHIGAECRSAGGPRPAKLVEDEETAGDFFGCVSFQEVEARRPGMNCKPMPTKVTLWNHVEQSLNKYAALADDYEDDNQECENVIAFEASGMKRAGDIVKAERKNAKRKEKTKESRAKETFIVEDFEYRPPGQVAVCEYAEEDEEGEENDEVNAAEDVLTVPVALDSGTVEHVAGPAHLPASTPVVKPASGRKSRNFVGANGSHIANYGEAAVEMEQEDETVISGSFHVADVTRPLHSTSRICDSVSKSCPAGHEVLYTKGEAVVVPEGSFSRFLGQVRRVATYKRTGGLYVARMKLRTPKIKADFTRQGPKH